MKRIITLLAFLIVGSSLYSQVGVRIYAQQNNFNNWQQILDSAPDPTTDNLFGTSYGITLDYWLRLKEYRVEFYPGIGFSTSASSNSNSSNELFPSNYGLGVAYLGLNTHIYFMDFKNDCECPTFSKQNGFVKKGLFLLLGVRGQYQSKSIKFEQTTFPENNREFTPSFQGGLGLDIGVSDLITITPIASISYTPAVAWEGITAHHRIVNVTAPDETSNNLAYRLGLRIGFRPDYLKNR